MPGRVVFSRVSGFSGIAISGFELLRVFSGIAISGFSLLRVASGIAISGFLGLIFGYPRKVKLQKGLESRNKREFSPYKGCTV